MLDKKFSDNCPCPQLLEIDARLLIAKQELQELRLLVDTQEATLKMYETHFSGLERTIQHMQDRIPKEK